MIRPVRFAAARPALSRLFRSGILKQSRATLPEIAACAFVVATIGAVLFGSHVEHGGRESDDWANAAMFRFEAHGDLGGAIERFHEQLGGRPLLAVALAAEQALWHDDIGAQLALAVALAGVASLLFFALLRTLGLHPSWAGVAAALSFVYPWADSSRLWAVAGPNQLSIILYFAGSLIAVRGLRSRGVTGGLWHATAIAFYILSVLVYEAAALAILLTGLLYTALAGWRCARARWAADVAVILPALVVLYVLDRSARAAPGIGSIKADLHMFPGQATRAILQSFVPIPVAPGVRALVLAVVAGAVVLAVRWMSPVSRRALIGPTALGAAALVGLAVAWFPFLGASLSPATPGVDNRGNLGAAFALALVVIAISRAGAEIALRLVRRQWAGNVAAIVVSLAIGTGWLLIARSHADAYDRAARSQQRLLSGLTNALPSPPSGATIYTLAHRAQAAPGIPVFSETWDLNGAVKLVWNDGTLRGFPIVGGAQLRCADRSVVPSSPRVHVTAVLEGGYGPRQGARYGRTFIYDARTKRAFRIDSRRKCRNLAHTIWPGAIGIANG